jgi:hypothetical protein
MIVDKDAVLQRQIARAGHSLEETLTWNGRFHSSRPASDNPSGVRLRRRPVARKADPYGEQHLDTMTASNR